MKLFELDDANALSPADYTAEQIGDAAILGVRRAQARNESSDPGLDAKIGASQSEAFGLGVQPEPHSSAIPPSFEPVTKRIP